MATRCQDVFPWPSWHLVWRKPHSSFSVCTASVLEGLVLSSIRSYCSTSWKWDGGGNDSCYCKLIVVYYFHQRKKARKSSGRLSWNITGAKRWTWKAFHFKLAAAVCDWKSSEEELAPKQPPLNWAVFINLWLFLSGCLRASSHKFICKARASYITAPPQLLQKKKKKHKKKSRVFICWWRESHFQIPTHNSLNCGPSLSHGTLILATKAVTSFDNCDPKNDYVSSWPKGKTGRKNT